MWWIAHKHANKGIPEPLQLEIELEGLINHMQINAEIFRPLHGYVRVHQVPLLAIDRT